MPIVEAVGAAVMSKNKNRAKAIEAAMSQAVLIAHEKGITDPVEIKKLMMLAREQVKKQMDANPKALDND